MATELEIIEQPNEGLTREDFSSGKVYFQLFCHNKYLQLSVDSRYRRITTYLRNQSQFPARPGATKRLYQRAAEIMQQTTDFLGINLDYEFNTYYEKMRLWVLDQDKGERIFEWDRLEFSDRLFIARRRFYPVPSDHS